MLSSVRISQWFVFIGLSCEKNLILFWEKKEDISNNSKNISSWGGLTCELVRFSSLEALEEKLSDLGRDLSEY